MNKVLSFQEAALQRAAREAERQFAAEGIERVPGPKVSNPQAGQGKRPEVRFTFEYQNGDTVAIPMSVFVDVSVGDAPVADVPEEIVRQILGQWAMARLKALRETGV